MGQIQFTNHITVKNSHKKISVLTIEPIQIANLKFNTLKQKLRDSMKSIYVSYSPISTIILNEDGDLQEIYPNLDDDVIGGINSLMEKGVTSVITDSKVVCNVLREKQITCKIDMTSEILSGWRSNRYSYNLENTGKIQNYEDYKAKLRSHAIEEAKTVIRANSGKRDELAAQIIHTIDDLKKSLNSASIRLNEMYSLHFPELVNNINNPTTLAKLIISCPNRLELKAAPLEEYKLPQEKVQEILSSINDSLGGNMTDADLKPIVQYAHTVIDISNQLDELELWIEKEMSSIAPNLAAVAGPNVSARLIAQFGSLQQLSMKSSSKVQMIGAEKALYSALKSRGSPPKHGIIFQIPEIGNSPYWIRGKLARSYAGKISIAARLDYFNGEFLGEKYRTELRDLEKQLREQYPKAPEKKDRENKYQRKSKPMGNKQRRSRR